ncbi:flagellar hook-associated protein FlgL [Planococcus salinus]|uniref:Flagellar hook-associated protein 3 n=1 Tax=Planococcus salinus TaxID=1848460 RepID=A0A3M8P516_9BACL|nr:flagellar hook-associated protein FlgL [Planococcus salinus]RNF38763.1 flagellar hook-associated protein 3 [Planococcus salinus]
MRISHQMLHQNSLANMNKSLGRFDKAYNQAVTGKQIQKPSDDPHGAGKAMQLKSAIAANDQYERNTNEANLWLDETDQTVYGMVNVMQRVRELAVQGNNDTLSSEDRTAVAGEVEELTEQLRQFANVKVNGHYLFNGQDTANPPFPDGGTGHGFDTNAKEFTIAGGMKIPASVTADRLFGSGDDELFAALGTLSENIRSGEDVPLEDIDTGIDRLLAVSAEVGVRRNRVEAVSQRIQDSSLQLTSMLSKIEDVDLAEAITKLKSEESVYQASLSASAKIIQPSLMDFLR